MLVDLAVMVTSGGEAISDLVVPRNQPRLFGEVASNPTAWRTWKQSMRTRLASIASARAAARGHDLGERRRHYYVLRNLAEQ